MEVATLAHTKSAKKRIKTSQKRREQNKPIQSRVKTHLVQAEEALLSGEVESAAQAVMQAISTLDKAAKQGVIHPNKAARHKSHLMKKLNVLRSTSPA